MEDLELRLPELQHIAILQPAIGSEAAGALHSPVRRGDLDLVDPERVVRMRSFDLQAGAISELRRAATVVQVAVGHPDPVQFQPARRDQPDQAFRLGAGIDDRRFLGLGAPDQGAVLPERRDRHDQDADRGNGSGWGVQGGSGAAKGGRDRRPGLRIGAGCRFTTNAWAAGERPR